MPNSGGTMLGIRFEVSGRFGCVKNSARWIHGNLNSDKMVNAHTRRSYGRTWPWPPALSRHVGSVSWDSFQPSFPRPPGSASHAEPEAGPWPQDRTP